MLTALHRVPLPVTNVLLLSIFPQTSLHAIPALMVALLARALQLVIHAHQETELEQTLRIQNCVLRSVVMMTNIRTRPQFLVNSAVLLLKTVFDALEMTYAENVLTIIN